MSWQEGLIRLCLPLIPRFVVRRVARRYIAGESLEDAVLTVKELNREGALCTLDVLGEEARRPEEVEGAAADYLGALEAIGRELLGCNISLKVTQFGLRIDERLCLEAIGRVALKAAEQESFVRIDMEDHTTVDATLRIYRELQPRHGNLGLVLQARLRRTLADLSALLPLHPNVRLCKGIYREPRGRAWLDPEIVRQSFVHLLERLLDAGCYVAIATHDERLVHAAMCLVDRLGLSPSAYEFQMLLGVDPELRRIILDGGHRLRVYTPFGVDWYRYSVRRLAENPSIARQVLRAMFRGRQSRPALSPAAAPLALPGRTEAETDQ